MPCFFSPTWGKIYGEKNIEHGNAIFSHTPFQRTYSEFTHLNYNTAFERDRDDDNIRNFQHVVTQTHEGNLLNLVNYHGYRDRDSKKGNALTQRHCARLADYIGALKGPVILMGDFNLAPDAPSLDPLYAILNNVGHARGVSTTRNFLARSQDAVDMIWVSQDIHVRDFTVLPDIVSDHAALMLRFDV